MTKYKIVHDENGFASLTRVEEEIKVPQEQEVKPITKKGKKK